MRDAPRIRGGGKKPFVIGFGRDEVVDVRDGILLTGMRPDPPRAAPHGPVPEAWLARTVSQMDEMQAGAGPGADDDAATRAPPAQPPPLAPLAPLAPVVHGRWASTRRAQGAQAAEEGS